MDPLAPCPVGGMVGILLSLLVAACSGSELVQTGGGPVRTSAQVRCSDGFCVFTVEASYARPVDNLTASSVQIDALRQAASDRAWRDCDRLFPSAGSAPRFAENGAGPHADASGRLMFTGLYSCIGPQGPAAH